ncbi:U32 family peptidase [Ligaoa zhengdingensis]|uniref:U32 family peptidase n=1 Tax=Ligaoa zhengdingensis TaxID=2763658 RepID=UPI0031B9ACAC
MSNPAPEVLAPAGGMEQLVAAAACGADAVYFGASTLNARRGASNFEGDKLREAVEYCHLRGVKVNLTLNTVVLERELSEALELVKTACALGIDALIVQDLGLASLIRETAPDMPLHASTQMAIHNLAGAKQLEQLGFSRAVLAREMSRAEIAEVVRGTSLETEVFVHGALCMCVSGQCYLSSMIGARSGNRGLCAQPCRLPFYSRERDACGLSLKDLSLVQQLGELRDLGVTSLKIEGRMKRPEYVAAAVTACRAALEGRPTDLNQLQSVFSRSGFTRGYYNSALGPEMFGTRRKEDVVSAEGVLRDLARLYQKESPRVALTGRFVMQAGQPVRLEVADRDGNLVEETGDCPQPAVNKPTTPELIEQSLGKLGGTPYRWESLAVELDAGEPLALPVSRLNALRRSALERLSALRAAAKPVGFCPPAHDLAAVPKLLIYKRPTLRARFARADQVPPGAAQALEQVILPVAEAAKVDDPALLAKLVGELPRIDFDNYRGLDAPLARLKERGVIRLLAGNLGAVYEAKRRGFQAAGDWGLNVVNSYALRACAALGCEDVTLSFELSLAEAKRLGDFAPHGIVAYGCLPLMIVRNCPARRETGCKGCPGWTEMRDRLGNRFPVGCGGSHKLAEVLNCKPVYLADRLPELDGLDFLTLYFTTESPAECARVIEEYRRGGKRQEITRGLYYRNIL